MIVKKWNERKFLAQTNVPNGRWGDQWVGVELYEPTWPDEGKSMILFHDGHSDPLVCPDAEIAMRFFNERVATAA